MDFSNYDSVIETLNATFRIKQNFDIVTKNLQLPHAKARIYFIDGMIKDTIVSKLLDSLLAPPNQKLPKEFYTDASLFSQQFIPYTEISFSHDITELSTQMLAGNLLLIVEGLTDGLLLDVRTYLNRSPEEPSIDKVLRGSRDGFVETLLFNTVLIRRRFRDPMLTMEWHQAGSVSKTDIVLCYLENRVDQRALQCLRQKINSIDVRTLTMNQESLAECFMPPQWYNPFPRFRYTERPDCACACIAEGKIVVLIDNCASVMLLPVSLFDFIQDANDFYFPPIVGNYLRFLRTAIFLLALFLTPCWLLLIQNPSVIPPWLEFIKVNEPNSIPIPLQLFLLEFMIDGLKLASLNTPESLNNSFSIVGALILGDFAVQARWFVPEVVLYMAFIAIANFTQPSFELGYSFKLSRLLLLACIWIGNFIGFCIGLVFLIVMICTTKTVCGQSYLRPLIPFRPKELFRLIIRHPIDKSNT